jgi:hypothetical protein
MAKKNIVLMLSLILIIVSNSIASAQWVYKRAVKFPDADTAVVAPFLCDVAANGKLYVISSKSGNIKAHDAVWCMNASDEVMTKFVDYTEKGDTINVRMLTGITHVNNDILVSSKVNPRVAAGGSSDLNYYSNGDTAKVRYGYAPYLSGWGTYVFGIAATKDSVVFSGTNFTSGMRAYNFTKNKSLSAYAAYISPDNANMEPGGKSPDGFDVIRDCAVVPDGDYFNSDTPWYTSRNSKKTGTLNGGIAVWTGGTQYNKANGTSNHQNYVPLRVTDDNDDLTLGSSIPCGITVDKKGLLWVAGIDSSRRWVKGFNVTKGVASAKAELKDELPSSGKAIDPDPAGAPMAGPCDVSFSPDGKTAYVIDAWKKVVFVFSNPAVGVREETKTPADFKLEQNYPNPFNPSTVIKYSLAGQCNVSLKVYDVLGREVANLVSGVENAGSHIVQFNAGKLGSGIYYYSLKAGSYTATNKMMLIK